MSARHGCTHVNKAIAADPRYAGLVERWGEPSHLGKAPAAAAPAAAVTVAGGDSE